MDHLTIEEQNVVERYLLGHLDTEEAMRFEQHYLDCPRCLEQLEIGQVLCQGLKQVAAEEGARLAGAAALAWLQRRGRVLQWGLALVLLGLIILPWALLTPRVTHLAGEQDRLADELSQALAPQVGTLTYSLSPERTTPGEEPSTRITLGAEPEWVVLALPLPPSEVTSPAEASYRVRLLEAAGETVWQSRPIRADASGRVTLSVHSSWLEASTYYAELDALTSDGEAQPVARFAFQVRRNE